MPKPIQIYKTLFRTEELIAADVQFRVKLFGQLIFCESIFSKNHDYSFRKILPPYCTFLFIHGFYPLINDNLQQQAATIFRQWFVTNSESEKWPMVTLDDLTSLVSRGIAPKYDDNSVQIVLNQKCIRDHYIDISLGRRHKPKTINEKWLQYGDLLINSTGEGTLGRAAQVWFIPENMTVDSHVTVVRPKNQLLLFYIGLWGISHEREIEALHTGSTGQTELPRERVKAMELRLPDDATLMRFNAVIAPMVSQIIVNQQENTRLASVRDALLPKLMSGEVDVSAIQT